MNQQPARANRRRQDGALLIEVLVAMLLMSFGMLSLGVMLSFSVQMTRLSSYRSSAINLAASHIGRIRANPGGMQYYQQPLHETAWSFDEIDSDTCSYPSCTTQSLAIMDDAATRRAVRLQLPAGDLLMTCDTGVCGPNAYGNLWVVWQEPATAGTIDLSTADHCPALVTNLYTDPRPRCFYVRFQI